MFGTHKCEISREYNGRYILNISMGKSLMLSKLPMSKSQSVEILSSFDSAQKGGVLLDAGVVNIENSSEGTILRFKMRDGTFDDDAFIISEDSMSLCPYDKDDNVAKSISRFAWVQKAEEKQEERIVGAAVMIPGVADYHGTVYSGDTSRSSAYYFMENYLTDNQHGINIQHEDKQIERAIKVIESFVTDRQMTYTVDVDVTDEQHQSRQRKKVTYPKDTWIMFARILSDVLWDKIKAGAFTGWSPEGLGMVAPLVENEASDQ